MLNKYKNYDTDFINNNLMGPNVIKIVEEITEKLDIKEGMRVLDLGCGNALSSIFIAKEYGATVYATDLWIPATDNFERVNIMGLENKVIPIHANAHSLPYADGFFDVAVCFNSYHYFGTNERYLIDYFSKLVKTNGIIACASPGFKHELNEVEIEELKPYWIVEKMLTFHCNKWWRNLWERSFVVDIIDSFDLSCNDEAWEDWINSLNPIGQNDRAFFENVKQLATVAIIAKRNNVDWHAL
jgi:cyclopropane fatty-acyl-phospholipid synthase-like methyltransferase